MSRRGDKLRTHGMSASPEYVAWIGMRQRCNDPQHRQYHDYGGRGITVCNRWQNSFLSFYADVGPRPSDKHSLDRIENEGNYEPGNCRWATPAQQAQNTRRSKRTLGRRRFEAAARAAQNLHRRFTPGQLRAARATLDWSQPKLAEMSGVHINCIKLFELQRSKPTWSTIAQLEQTLKKAGVVFIDGDDQFGPGVRLREPQR
jgi:ribosome-binding protein aMBF1 (putative translation factor)